MVGSCHALVLVDKIYSIQRGMDISRMQGISCYMVVITANICSLQVLDAPSLQDDFYLNLVDWSSQNVLAVGLGTCVYLWTATTSKVSRT